MAQVTLPMGDKKYLRKSRKRVFPNDERDRKSVHEQFGASTEDSTQCKRDRSS